MALGSITATTPTTVLQFTGTGFDATRVFNPQVVQVGGQYAMLFGGLPFANNIQIGLATSADGVTWTESASNPVINNAASPAWAAFREIPAALLYENGVYQLWFNGDNTNLSSDGGATNGFGYATSTDGVNWTINTAPILDGPTGSGFSLQAVTNLNGQYHAYYTSDADGKLYEATSSDGVSFSTGTAVNAPSGYSLEALTTVGGSNQIVSVWHDSSGAAYLGASADGVNFTILDTVNLPIGFTVNDILVSNGQMTFYGTRDVGNVNWAYDNTDIQYTTAPLPALLQPQPTISSITLQPSNGDVGPGAVVTLAVDFSEAVSVTGGIPTISLSDGGLASYSARSGTDTLLFTYTVGKTGSGENTPDLAIAATNAIQLNGATIQDASSGVAADLSAANGYNPNGTLQIDTAAPSIGNESQLEGIISFANSHADTNSVPGVDQTQGVITFADQTDTTKLTIVSTTYDYRGADGTSLTAPDASAIKKAFQIASFDFAGGEGQLTWNYAIPNDDLLFLEPGSSLTVTSAVAIADAVDNVATEDVSVTIEGDHATSVVRGTSKAVPTSEGLLASPSDGSLNHLLQITSVIPDGNQNKGVLVQGDSTAVQGLYGTLIVNRDGSYRYVAEPNVTLPANVDVGLDNFQYTASDGNGLNLTSFLTVSVTPGVASVSSISLSLPFAKGVNPVVTQYPGQNDHGNASPGNPAPQVDESLYWAVDYAAPEGTQVLAQASGRVLAFTDTVPDGSAGPHSFGNYITIRYDDGVVATYMHLKQGSIPANLTNAPDAKVVAGKPIGAIGLTGDTTGPHLHVTYGDFTVAFANDPPTSFVPGAHGHGATGIFADGSLAANNGAPIILPSESAPAAEATGTFSSGANLNLNLLVQSMSAGFGMDGFASTPPLAGITGAEQQVLHSFLVHPYG